MTVKCVARAEGLQPITCDHGRALEKVKFPSSDCPRLATRVRPPSIASKFYPRTLFTKPGEPELPVTSDFDNQRPPGRLISTKMVRPSPLSQAPKRCPQTGEK